MNPVLFATYHPYEDSGFWEGYALVLVHVKRFSGSIRRKTLNWINNVYSSSPLHRHRLLPVSYIIEIYCIVSDGMTDRHNVTSKPIFHLFFFFYKALKYDSLKEIPGTTSQTTFSNPELLHKNLSCHLSYETEIPLWSCVVFLSWRLINFGDKCLNL
jgi:hypothetical protein